MNNLSNIHENGPVENINSLSRSIHLSANQSHLLDMSSVRMIVSTSNCQRKNYLGAHSTLKCRLLEISEFPVLFDINVSVSKL